MNKKQGLAICRLQDALAECSQTGALDALRGQVGGEEIMVFCDAVFYAWCEVKGKAAKRYIASVRSTAAPGRP